MQEHAETGARRPGSGQIAWPTRPLIYEINTWVWLFELSQRDGRPITLGSVPEHDWDAIAALGFDAVWLMGVWERSPRGTQIARSEPNLQAAYRAALPDLTAEDVVGSPYCVRRYVVDERLGGSAGLAAAREALRRRGLRLMLDFVPNHVALDHHWLTEHPEFFIHGSPRDLDADPASFVRVGDTIVAHGRDPHFPAWTDVAQLNAFSEGYRRAATETLIEIGDQCDGVRCDMAMLLLNQVFERVWGARASNRPEGEYWSDVLAGVRAIHPGMLFMAEVYWDLEWELQQLGFDYCYDKRLYDRLRHSTPTGVQQHLAADLAYQDRLVRFLENHDEPRAAAIFSPARHRAALIASYTLPGAKLFHEGQLDGRRVRVPVQLRRRPAEVADDQIGRFAADLLAVLGSAPLLYGDWRLCDLSGWPDNLSYRQLVAWSWRLLDQACLVVVNLADREAQARVRLPWPQLAGRTWQLADTFSRETFIRDGDEMIGPGLFVALPAWGFHLLSLEFPSPG